MVKNLPAGAGDKRGGSGDPLEKEMKTYSSILAWKIPRQWSLVVYSPWGHKELDTTK